MKRYKITFLLMSFLIISHTGNAQKNNVSVSAKASGQKFEHYWSVCAGAGRANEGLRASWLEHLKLSRDSCGFRYLRFHGLFHDDMFVYREENGKPVYNWQYVDELFDRMLNIGVRPFVELGFFPKTMSPQSTVFWWGGHGTPPSNFENWKLLIDNFVKHCIARYGEEEVRKWYFEVWNEPNLSSFWNGTMDQYFDLYKTTVLSIKAIDSTLRVGGPATSSYLPDDSVYQRLLNTKITSKDFIGVESKGPWITEFLAYCEKENLPVDFISSHPYPTTYPLDGLGGRIEISRPVNATFTDIQWLRKTIANSKYKKAEIHLTEWSSSPSPRDHTHDYLQAATYIAKINIDCIGLVNSLSYWTFTDVFEENGAGDSIFHGGFGLVNYQGIVKPAFHAYSMLNQLGNEELKRVDMGILTRESSNGKIVGLFYNYPDEVIASAPISKGTYSIAEKTLATGSAKQLTLSISNLKPKARFVIEILDKNNGFALRDWQKMGSPNPPTREQTKQLQQKAFATKKLEILADKNGNLVWNTVLDPWAVILIKEN